MAIAYEVFGAFEADAVLVAEGRAARRAVRSPSHLSLRLRRQDDRVPAACPRLEILVSGVEHSHKPRRTPQRGLDPGRIVRTPKSFALIEVGAGTTPRPDREATL